MLIVGAVIQLLLKPRDPPHDPRYRAQPHHRHSRSTINVPLLKPAPQIRLLPERVAPGVAVPVDLSAVEPDDIILPEQLGEHHAHFEVGKAGKGVLAEFFPF